MGLPLPTRFGNCSVAAHFKFNKRDEAVVEKNYALGIMDRFAARRDGLSLVIVK